MKKVNKEELDALTWTYFLGEAWQEIIKKKYNLDVPFTTNNVVFKPKDLIERSFKLPSWNDPKSIMGGKN